MLIRPDPSSIEDLPLGIICLYGVIGLLREVRSKMWWHEVMLKQSSKP